MNEGVDLNAPFYVQGEPNHPFNMKFVDFFSPSLDNFHTVGGKAETKGGGLGRSHTPSASTTHLGHDCPPPANRKGPPGDRQAEARQTSQPCTKGYRGAQAKDPFEKKQLCHMDVVHVICL